MSTNAPAEEVCSDGPTDRDLPSDAFDLGVDGEGDRHTYSRIESRVWVTDPDTGALVLEQQLGDTGLPGWIAHTDQTRGWQTINYEDSFEDILRHGLKAGTDR